VRGRRKKKREKKFEPQSPDGLFGPEKRAIEGGKKGRKKDRDILVPSYQGKNNLRLKERNYLREEPPKKNEKGNSNSPISLNNLRQGPREKGGKKKRRIIPRSIEWGGRKGRGV